jgi:predicted GNAT family N-acyltransferase
LEQVYAIRYQCLTLEMGDESNANHQVKYYQDKHDEKCERILVAYVDTKVVGTARLILRKENEFLSDSFYDYEALAEMYGLPVVTMMKQVGLIDRVCILKAFRGHSIFRAFYEAVISEMKDNQCKYLLAAIHQDNLKSDRVFTHFGFYKLNQLRHDAYWKGYLYCLEIE